MYKSGWQWLRLHRLLGHMQFNCCIWWLGDSFYAAAWWTTVQKGIDCNLIYSISWVWHENMYALYCFLLSNKRENCHQNKLGVCVCASHLFCRSFFFHPMETSMNGMVKHTQTVKCSHKQEKLIFNGAATRDLFIKLKIQFRAWSVFSFPPIRLMKRHICPRASIEFELNTLATCIWFFFRSRCFFSVLHSHSF